MLCCSDMGLKMKHPASSWQKFSIRNTRIMHAIYFSIENLPLLLFTHACTFMLGAATYVVSFCPLLLDTNFELYNLREVQLWHLWTFYLPNM